MDGPLQDGSKQANLSVFIYESRFCFWTANFFRQKFSETLIKVLFLCKMKNVVTNTANNDAVDGLMLRPHGLVTLQREWLLQT